MSKYLVPNKSRSNYQLGICGRCNRKFFLTELESDPNIPGLLVCKKDKDIFDPWRYSPRPDDILVPLVPRPDVSLDTAFGELETEDGLTRTSNSYLVTDDSDGTDVFPRRAIRQD